MMPEARFGRKHELVQGLFSTSDLGWPTFWRNGINLLLELGMLVLDDREDPASSGALFVMVAKRTKQARK